MFLSTPTFDPTSTTVFSAAKLSQITSLPDPYDTIAVFGKDSQLQRWSSLIGIITAIIGNILISFALNIQRYAHIRLHEERMARKEKLKKIPKSSGGYGTTGTNGHVTELDGENGGEGDNLLSSSFNSDSTDCSHEDHSNYLQSPYWWGGILLMTIGEAGNFLAYGFAPASIVSPLGVVALISNCVIAPIMLKERFRYRDFWGVVVAVGGAVTVVLSAKTEEKKFGPHEIWGAITTSAFEIYLGVTIGLIAVLIWASPKYGNKTILIDLGLVGLFGGYTALSTKGVASMLSSTLWRALTTPVTYALLAVLISTAVMQVKYVNKALQRFDSTQVIPVQFVMFTLSVIIGSAILYRDFEKATTENVSKFVGGCLLTFFGVFLITSGRPRRDDEEEEEESDEEGEERIVLTDQEHAEEEARNEEDSRRRDSIRKGSIFQNGDGAGDDQGSSSRRDSHVSFMEPPGRPRTPRMYSNSSYKPSVRPTPSAQREETPLLKNPWKSPADNILQPSAHPGLQATLSSPVLPSEAQLSADANNVLTRTISQGNVHTHPNEQQPPPSPQPDRPVTPARHSISRMLPGPLLSPLSGGLSVVVADSLRRGMDPRSRSFRRPRLGLRRTKSGSQRLSNPNMMDDEDQLGTSPLKYSDQQEDVGASPGSAGSSRMTRARSLSNTLGDLFRGK
ncbi:magnesium transporter NIPA-domain-containing protein [Rhexocercosporidium sp. MPI-PUGE-AT-0058]|nr:magnesium transporter NIPA-domain-containing protein [Rhexocercosporidium sp. MPI-PUGE-AT-0058]